MKKLVTIITALATVVSLNAGVALAADCSISVTGPGSVNTCTNNTSKNVTITCTNGVSVTNATSQSAVSGTVSVVGNTISGSATSGDAANLNKVATELALNCGSAPKTVATTVTPSSTPSTPAGGQGGGTVAAATSTPAPAAPKAASVAELPKTGVSSTAKNLAIASASIGFVGIASQAGLVVLRRRAFKQ